MFTRIIENINNIVGIINSNSLPELIDIKKDIKKYLNIHTEILLGVKMEVAEVVKEMQAMALQLDKVQTEVQDHTAVMQAAIDQLEVSLKDALAKANTEAPVELLDALAAVKQRIQLLDNMNEDKVDPVPTPEPEPTPTPVEPVPVEPIPTPEPAPVEPAPVEPAPVVEVTPEPAPETPAAVDLTKPEETPTV